MRIYEVKVQQCNCIGYTVNEFTSIAQANKAIRKIAKQLEKNSAVSQSSCIANNKAYEFPDVFERKLVGIATCKEESPYFIQLARIQ